MPAVQKPTTEEEFDIIFNAAPKQGFVAINFYTSWADPCIQMNQTFEAIASTQPDSAVFIAVDAEELGDVSERYDVSAVPFFVLIQNGEIVHSISGADPRELQRQIERYSASKTSTGTSIPPAQQTESSTRVESSGASAGPLDGQAEEEEESLQERLAKLVGAAPVMLFMKGTPQDPQCGFSRKLVGLLRDNGVRYGFFNILKDDDVRQGLKEFSNWPTYPQLYVGGELVGGLDIVKEELENDPDFFKNVTPA